MAAALAAMPDDGEADLWPPCGAGLPHRADRGPDLTWPGDVVPQRPPAGLSDYPVSQALRDAWVAAGLAELPLADQYIAARALLHPPRPAKGGSPAVLVSADFCQRLFPEITHRAGRGALRASLVEGSVARLGALGVELEVVRAQVYAHHEDAGRAAKHALRLRIDQYPAELVAAHRSQAADVGHLENLVMLVGGGRYDARRQRAYRAQVVHRAVERITEASAQPWCAEGSPGHAHAAQMAYFVDALTPRSMAIPAERWAAAYALVPPAPAPLAAGASEEERTAHSRAWSRRQSILRVLDQVRSCPEEPPTPSWRGRTARIGSPMTNLPADIRRALRPDLWSIDGVAMHLAIAAWRWGCPEMQAYLVGCQQAGTTIWEAMASDITDATGQPIDAAAAKKHLKIVTYSLCYGKGRAALRADAAQRFEDLLAGGAVTAREEDEAEGGEDLSDELVQAYLSLPCMRGLLDARDRWMRRIQDDRGLTTVMGRRCDLAYFDDRRDLRAEIRSIAATDIQDAEQLLFAPIYQLASEELQKVTPRMRIVCPTHDGMLLRLDRCEAAWIARIRQLYLDACATMGVVGTDLTVEAPARREEHEMPVTTKEQHEQTEEQEAPQEPLGRDQGAPAQTDLALRSTPIHCVSIPVEPGADNDWAGYGAGQAWSDADTRGDVLDDGWVDPADSATAHVVGEGLAERVAVATE